MKYLEEALNIKVAYSPYGEKGKLPYLLTDRYRFRMANLGGVPSLFMFPVGEVEDIPSIKKHHEAVSRIAKVPVVLILEEMTARQRKALIADNIPFIQENRQIYLPFLGALLQERHDGVAMSKEILSPSAQLLLFHYIYEGKKELLVNHLAGILSLSAMSISRAARQLEEVGLVSTYKKGVNKIIFSSLRGKELYAKAEKFLRSPIKKRGFVNKVRDLQGYSAGLSALSELTMLNSPRIGTLAVSKLPEGVLLEKDLVDEENEQAVEIWSYDPGILAKNGKVDVLSLHQSLKDNEDERVQGELDKLLTEFWEEYYGKGI